MGLLFLASDIRKSAENIAKAIRDTK